MTGDRAADAVAGVVRRLDFPMFVVTAAADDELSGCLAGFVTQCSIEPVRYLVCLSTANHTAGVAERTGALAVHLLGADQHGLAEVFGALTGDVADKFSMVSWRPGTTGAPVLDECAAWFEGPVIHRFELGDHTGHVITPVDGGSGSHPGQLNYSAVSDVDAGHPPGD